MSIFGAIFSGISSVLSVVSNVFTPILTKILGPALEKLGRAFEAFFKELGLIEPEEKVEEIGDRALQAEVDEIHPVKIETFDNHEKYLAALKEYEPSAEKSALIPVDDKLHKGLEVLMGLAISRYGQSMSEFGQIILNNPEFYSQFGRLAEIGSIARDKTETFADIVNYIAGKSMSSEKTDTAIDALVDIEKKVNPEATDAEILKTVSDLKK